MGIGVLRMSVLALVLATTTLLAGEQPAAVQALAVVVPSRDILVASPYMALVRQVLVQDGDRVKVGDVLVELDEGLLKADLEAAQLRTAAAQARLVAADLQVKRLGVIQDSKAGYEAAGKDAQSLLAALDVKIAETALAEAQQDLKLQQVEMERVKLMLDRLRIRAPMDGVVERCLHDAGETVAAGEPVVRLVRLDPLNVVASVPEAVAAQIRPGMAAVVKFEGPPAVQQPCKVVLIDPMVDAASGTRRVLLALPNPEGAIVAGSKATVVIDLKGAEAPGADR